MNHDILLVIVILLIAVGIGMELQARGRDFIGWALIVGGLLIAVLTGTRI